ncbi:MAG: hypothetical protein CL853_02335, partial [Crocinitomicaceae bacterium]|nr:hypothetical protein [Crocinitomicaceae bacterium]
HLYQKNQIELNSFFEELHPDLVLVSGWFDKDYMNILRNRSFSFESVLLFDNYWKGSLKQIIGAFFFKIFLKNRFDFCWIPGEIQKDFALKLGFYNQDIRFGFYTTNLSLFNKHYKIGNKKKIIPKKFLYVGRYLKIKGILDLWDAFELFSRQFPDWELHCIGTGALIKEKKEHPKIFHHGFLQQYQLDLFIKQKGIFIMPSHFDHWGVAVQEFSSAGFPLILSDAVGAGCAFLINGENGFNFKSKNVNDLLEKMIRVAELPADKLVKFGNLSHELSNLYNLTTWNNTLLNFLNK